MLTNDLKYCRYINDGPVEEAVPRSASFETEELTGMVKFMDAVGCVLAVVTAAFFLLTAAAQLYMWVHR